MKVSVFGLGYLGTILCACLPDLGHEVIGIDVAEEKVSALADGRSLIFETGVAERLRRAMNAGKLAATLDDGIAVKGSDISFVTVDTPGTLDGGMGLEIGRDRAGANWRPDRSKVRPAHGRDALHDTSWNCARAGGSYP